MMHIPMQKYIGEYIKTVEKEEMSTKVKLYEVPRRTVVRVPPGDFPFFFDHIDGMYSLCYDEHKNVHHLAAWTEVVPVTDVTVLDKFKGF